MRKAGIVVVAIVAAAVLLPFAADGVLIGWEYDPQKWTDAIDKPFADGRLLICHYIDFSDIGFLGRRPLTKAEPYWPADAQQVILPGGLMVSEERIGVKACPWAQGWKAKLLAW